MLTILVKTIANTNSNTLAKCIADTNTNIAFKKYLNKLGTHTGRQTDRQRDWLQWKMQPVNGRTSEQSRFL